MYLCCVIQLRDFQKYNQTMWSINTTCFFFLSYFTKTTKMERYYFLRYEINSKFNLFFYCEKFRTLQMKCWQGFKRLDFCFKPKLPANCTTKHSMWRPLPDVWKQIITQTHVYIHMLQGRYTLGAYTFIRDSLKIFILLTNLTKQLNIPNPTLSSKFLFLVWEAKHTVEIFL